MDRTVVQWMEILASDQKDEDDFPLYPLEVKERVFKACQEWLIKRKKLFPDERPSEGRGVTEMRVWLRDPSVQKEMRKMLGLETARAAGAVAKPRDRDAEQKNAAKGSALNALVFEGEGLEDADVR